jgi:hypothetical protein
MIDSEQPAPVWEDWGIDPILAAAYRYADACLVDRKEGPLSLAALRELQAVVQAAQNKAVRNSDIPDRPDPKPFDLPGVTDPFGSPVTHADCMRYVTDAQHA